MLGTTVQAVSQQVGSRILQHQLTRGFTVVRESDGSASFALGMLDKGATPDAPYARGDSDWQLLANERTELAWWRTGLTALAVALGVGRVVPELDNSSLRWPYVVAGVGFAIWGILAMSYGSTRRTTVDRVLESGRFPEPSHRLLQALAMAA